MRRRRMRAQKSKEISSFRFLTYASRSISILAGCGFNEIGDSELVSFAFWATHEFKFTMQNRLGLWRKGERGAQLPEFVYYVWKPDVEKCWRGLLKHRAAPEVESEPQPKDKGGRPHALTPEEA